MHRSIRAVTVAGAIAALTISTAGIALAQSPAASTAAGGKGMICVIVPPFL